MNKKRIIKELTAKGYDQVKLAKEMGKSQPAISLVIARKSTSVVIMQRIAEIIETPFSEVWGIDRNTITRNPKKDVSKTAS